MKTTIYAYYGVLAHEKVPCYSPYKVEGIRDELTVEIPYPTWRNYMDDLGVTLGGRDYLLHEVLTDWHGAPALCWVNNNEKKHRVLLTVCAHDDGQ